jgi:hypothetical protein
MELLDRCFCRNYTSGSHTVVRKPVVFLSFILRRLFSYTGHTELNEWINVNDDLGRMWNGVVAAYLMLLTHNSLGMTEKNHTEPARSFPFWKENKLCDWFLVYLTFRCQLHSSQNNQEWLMAEGRWTTGPYLTSCLSHSNFQFWLAASSDVSDVKHFVRMHLQ